jgi:hypothetical protein
MVAIRSSETSVNKTHTASNPRERHSPSSLQWKPKILQRLCHFRGNAAKWAGLHIRRRGQQRRICHSAAAHCVILAWSLSHKARKEVSEIERQKIRCRLIYFRADGIRNEFLSGKLPWCMEFRVSLGRATLYSRICSIANQHEIIGCRCTAQPIALSREMPAEISLENIKNNLRSH